MLMTWFILKIIISWLMILEKSMIGEFKIIDIGLLSCFLRIKVKQVENGIFIKLYLCYASKI